MAAAEAHAGAVARHLATRLAALRHNNGKPVVVLYGAGWKGLVSGGANGGGGDGDGDGGGGEGGTGDGSGYGGVNVVELMGGGVVGQGATVAFNVLRPDGGFVGYTQVVGSDKCMLATSFTTFGPSLLE